MDRKDIYTKIDLERLFQDKKHGDQTNKNDKTWFMILGEEIGEVARTIIGSHDLNFLKIELTQVAAVAIAWIEAIEKRERK